MAEICYPIEAALWIAIGRVPEFAFDGISDEARGYATADDFGFNLDEWRDFNIDELRFFHPDVNYQRYVNALHLWPGFRTVEEMERQVAQNQAMLSRYDEAPHFADHYMTEIDTKTREEVQWVEQIERPVRRTAEIGKSQLLCALVEGRIRLTGIPTDRTKPIEELDAGEFKVPPVEIPVEEILIDNIDWENHHVITKRYRYLLATMSTASLLDCFPEPMVGTEQGNVQMHGGTIALLDSVATSPKRSYRKTQHTDIRDIIRNEFARRKKAGVLPEQKEAVYADAIEWAREVLLREVPRSTMQRYLAEIVGA